MALSISGLITLLVIVLIGPLVFLVRALIGNNDMEVIRKATSRKEREESSTLAYTLSLLGYAIGIGNLWRFPYLVGKWGGGAFLIAYFTCLFLVSMPMYLVEMAVGHQTRLSTVDCLKAIHPRWEGLGIAQITMTFLCSTLYSVVIGYAVVYVYGSLQDPLPWEGSQQAAEDYWANSVLNRWPNGGEGQFLGGIQMPVALGLFIVHLMNFAAVAFGTEVLEKVTWVTVVGPLVLLAILLVQALRLDGAMDGISFYILRFDGTKLADPEMWATACSQILFSLSPGFGTAMSMSSTTSKRTNVFKTCLTVAASNSSFSLMGGFAMFGILGNLAKIQGKAVSELAESSGQGLAFITIAEGMKTFGPAKNVMSVLFFTMLIALGLDSSFAWIETVVIVIMDFTRARNMQLNKVLVTGVTIVVLFFIGLVYCTRAGTYLIDVVDRFVAIHFLLVACAVEAVALAIGYGFPRMVRGIKRADPEGLQVFAPEVWKIITHYVMAAGPIVLYLYTLVTDIMNPYGGYPVWLLIVGWCANILCMGIMISTLFRQGESSLSLEEDNSPEERSDQVTEMIEQS